MDKAKIIELITDNEHHEALQEMLQYANAHTPQYVSEINTHIQNLNNLKDDNGIGVISRDEFKCDMARLTRALFELLDKMENNEPVKDNTNPTNQGGVNIGTINISGGNVQIADIINNVNDKKTTALLTPNNGVFKIGTTLNIQWISSHQHHYGIYISEGSNNKIIGTIYHTDFDRQSNSFQWTIPKSIEYTGKVHNISGNKYRIKLVIWNTGNPQTAITTSDFSENFISILAE